MLESTPVRAYMDFSQFSKMRLDAQTAPQESLHEVAKQFESIFINMVLKSMRDASFGDPLFDSNQSEFYREMSDKQLSLEMTKDKGIGLATALVQQMQKYIPKDENKITDAASINNKITDPFIIDRNKTEFKTTVEFVDFLMPYAESAADSLGVDPKVLVAQAALETGWGKAIGKNGNGQSSYNLFNIKAQAGYQGNSYTKQTVEYDGSAARLEKSSFRAYSGYQESFDDYVNFIRNNARYQNALDNASDPGDYINAIQKAGYATDPHYATKIEHIFKSMPTETILDSSDYV